MARARDRRRDEAPKAAMLEHVPAGATPVRRRAARPSRRPRACKPYIDAGFTGFTFNNTIYRTPEQIALLGELLELIGGGVATPA